MAIILVARGFQKKQSAHIFQFLSGTERPWWWREGASFQFGHHITDNWENIFLFVFFHYPVASTTFWTERIVSFSVRRIYTICNCCLFGVSNGVPCETDKTRYKSESSPPLPPARARRSLQKDVNTRTRIVVIIPLAVRTVFRTYKLRKEIQVPFFLPVLLFKPQSYHNKTRK